MIVLVRSGAKYGPEYVTALTAQIKEHSDEGVITLTDQPDTPGETRELKMGWPGWWAKLELFAPWNVDLRPFLFIDLDSFVLGDFKHLKNTRFTMVKDFQGWVKANSSVMWVCEPDNIWAAFMTDPEAHMKDCGGKGDQEFIGRFCDDLWAPLTSGVTSYKNHGIEGPLGCIMQFHGNPKPCNADGWAKARWDKYAGP